MHPEVWIIYVLALVLSFVSTYWLQRLLMPCLYNLLLLLLLPSEHDNDIRDISYKNTPSP